MTRLPFPFRSLRPSARIILIAAGFALAGIGRAAGGDSRLPPPPCDWAAAGTNGDLAAEGFERANRSMHAWQEFRRGKSMLHGDQITGKGRSHDIWKVCNAAADCYPFHVLTAALTERAMFEGAMRDMLHSEIRWTSRDLGDGRRVLPADWNVATDAFANPVPKLREISFGASEYCKDGLMPISEWLGPQTEWYARMIQITDYLWEHQAAGRSDQGKAIPLAADDLSSRRNIEAHGEQLQILPRLHWATGDARYKEWAIRLGDQYLLGRHHPTDDLDYLRLRDHGNEIISGLTELYAMLSLQGDPKAGAYREPLYRMLDVVLTCGRNEDGLFQDNLYPHERKRGGSVADTFGYVYNAFYIVQMIDRQSADPELRATAERYRREMIRALENLDQPKYRNFKWEGNSSDGYADAIEGALNLYNRERLSRLAAWIDSEIRVMWAMQGDKAVSQPNYPDGNFCRTTLMYCLWKTRGLHTADWRRDLSFGAVEKPDGSGLVVSITARDRDWTGRLRFDQPRHRTFFRMPLDYPRINSFPEWFTVEAAANYEIRETIDGAEDRVRRLRGAELIEGLELELKQGIERRFTVTRVDAAAP